jgi:4,5-dihydroxyphthalate decarboxylase
MLESGELDAVISARAPSCFLNGAANVGRLFPDYPDAERRYYAQHKIFPIMHIIGVRKALAERHPWLPVSLYKAFSAARDLAMAELGQIGHLFVSLPWAVAHFEQARSSLGNDYWSYGLANNRHVLDVFTRYHHAQGLSKTLVRPEQLFASSTLDMSKI